MLTHGIDVSEWQGDIAWELVSADFCIIRAGYGRSALQKDKKFEHNYKGCKDNGIPCGVYWYSYALTPADAVLEAKACLEVIKEKKYEYPIYFDVEQSSQFALGKAAVSAIIRAFLNTIESAGYWAGLYMSAYYLSTFTEDDIKNRYAVWVAHYDVNKPAYSGTYGMWQKSNTGIESGINGNVDLDECYLDYPALIKEAGLNGYLPYNEKKYVRLTIDGRTYEGMMYEIIE